MSTKAKVDKSKSASATDAVDSALGHLTARVKREREHNDALVQSGVMIRREHTVNARRLRARLNDPSAPFSDEERQSLGDEYSDACASRSLADASLGTAFALGKRLQ